MLLTKDQRDKIIRYAKQWRQYDTEQEHPVLETNQPLPRINYLLPEGFSQPGAQQGAGRGGSRKNAVSEKPPLEF